MLRSERGRLSAGEPLPDDLARALLRFFLRVRVRRFRVRRISGTAAAAARGGRRLLGGASREAERDNDGGEEEGDGFHARYVWREFEEKASGYLCFFAGST